MMAGSGGPYGKVAGFSSLALVTGASSGIGRAVAVRLARGGYEVVAVGRNAAGLDDVVERCGRLGGRAHAVQLDLRNVAAVREVISDAREHFGDPAVLIAAAGVSPDAFAALEDIPEEEWDREYETNVRGVQIVVQASVGAMKDRSDGEIVAIGSSASYRALPGNAAYAASKFALRAMFQALADELDGTGVRAHLVSPGPVDTEIWDKKRQPPTDEFRTTLLSPEHIAEVVDWLIHTPKRIRIDEILVRPHSTSPTPIRND